LGNSGAFQLIDVTYFFLRYVFIYKETRVITKMTSVQMAGDESICFLYSVGRLVPPIVIDLVSSDDDEDAFETISEEN